MAPVDNLVDEIVDKPPASDPGRAVSWGTGWRTSGGGPRHPEPMRPDRPLPRSSAPSRRERRRALYCLIRARPPRLRCPRRRSISCGSAIADGGLAGRSCTTRCAPLRTVGSTRAGAWRSSPSTGSASHCSRRRPSPGSQRTSPGRNPTTSDRRDPDTGGGPLTGVRPIHDHRPAPVASAGAAGFAGQARILRRAISPSIWRSAST